MAWISSNLGSNPGFSLPIGGPLPRINPRPDTAALPGQPMHPTLETAPAGAARPDRADALACDGVLAQALLAHAQQQGLALGVKAAECLRLRRPRRRARQARHANQRAGLPNIAKRPEPVEDRVEVGHWEIDQIIGARNQSSLLTFTERVTRYAMAITMPEGYDAEATVSPLGDRIVFTSTRDGDPELYLMNIDGKKPVRLTTSKGYDGGAFFSPDGKRLVYRANHPEGADELAKYDELVKEHLVRPTRLELFVMDIDGKNNRQVTSNGKANFAPFFHPDGKRIIFSSNQADPKGRDFDLFLIGDDGNNQEQVTFNPSFDGFPMFTKDGKQLVFASNRGAAKQGDTNVFLAEWQN